MNYPRPTNEYAIQPPPPTHVAEDIPFQVTEATRRFTQLLIDVLPPLGEHPRLKEIAEETAR